MVYRLFLLILCAFSLAACNEGFRYNQAPLKLNKKLPIDPGNPSGPTNPNPPNTQPGPTDVSQVSTVNFGGNVAAFRVNTRITRIEIRSNGVHVEFDKQYGANRWPDVTPPGWEGPLQYTLWMVLKVNGQWYAAPGGHLWYDCPEWGGDITEPTQVSRNWFYGNSWGALSGYQPAHGEAMGFFVSSGNQRMVFGDESQSTVRERSEIVYIQLPSAPGAAFSF